MTVTVELDCLECDRRRTFDVAYRDVGDVLWCYCLACGDRTKHVPVGEDLRYRGIKLGFGEHRASTPDRGEPAEKGVST